MTGKLILVRHTQVEVHYSDICYGQSDVALSPDGQEHARELGKTLAQENPAIVMHSGLTRARFLADEVAHHSGLKATDDKRLAEMNFGEWELKLWDDIFAKVGHGMSRLIHEPDTYCAPGGETAHQVRDRMISWMAQLPRDKTIIAISHGGAISALRGTISNTPSANWPDLMPKFGQATHIPLPTKT